MLDDALLFIPYVLFAKSGFAPSKPTNVWGFVYAVFVFGLVWRLRDAGFAQTACRGAVFGSRIRQMREIGYGDVGYGTIEWFLEFGMLKCFCQVYPRDFPGFHTLTTATMSNFITNYNPTTTTFPKRNVIKVTQYQHPVSYVCTVRILPANQLFLPTDGKQPR